LLEKATLDRESRIRMIVVRTLRTTAPSSADANGKNAAVTIKAAFEKIIVFSFVVNNLLFAEIMR
jgi:hypothetical protein